MVANLLPVLMIASACVQKSAIVSLSALTVPIEKQHQQRMSGVQRRMTQG